MLFCFESVETDKIGLYEVEGLVKGYNEQQINLIDDKGNTIQVKEHVADAEAINNELFPFDW